MKVAAIDIGTNTTRLLITNLETGEIITKKRTVTRLGENFNGKLQTNAKKRVLTALENYKKEIEKYNIKIYRAVATSVVRESSNGLEFLKEIYSKINLKVEVISGEEEANLTFLGVLSALNKNINNFLLLDIGGGSNEFAVIKNRKLINSISRKFGVVFLYEKFITHDPPTKEEIEKVSNGIKKNILIIKDKFNNQIKEIPYFVGTAGTITTLSAIHQNLSQYNPELINNHKIPKYFLDQLIENMLTLSNYERLKKYNIEKGREDVILVGLLIVKYCMEIFKFDSIISIDSSLLEGIAYSLKFYQPSSPINGTKEHKKYSS